MRKNIIWFLLSVLCSFYCLLVSGCQYHTYYEDPAPTSSTPRYELKEDVPVSKERVVERHYVVE